ncbi:hypothetical protein GVX76_10205 [[Haemophilus] felis]|nr:hypothetical protein [[Haemophilus] felis]
MLILKFENGKKFYTDAIGNRYQYDLNNMADKLAYDVDLAAQQRDKLSLKLGRDKNGGGIYE